MQGQSACVKSSPVDISGSPYMGRFYARSKFLHKILQSSCMKSFIGGALYIGRFYARSKFLHEISPRIVLHDMLHFYMLRKVPP